MKNFTYYKKITVLVLVLLLINVNSVYANHPDNYYIQEIGQMNLSYYDHNVGYVKGMKIKVEPHRITILDPIEIEITNTNIMFSLAYVSIRHVLGSMGETVYGEMTGNLTGVINPHSINRTPSTSYNFSIHAVTPSPSNRISSTQGVFWTPPANAIIQVEDIGQTAITLKIDGKQNPASGVLWRSDNLQNWLQLSTGINGGISRFVDENLEPDKTYYYRVGWRTTISNSFNYPWEWVYNWQGGNHYIEVKTSSDPAVVYAQLAANAAMLAEEAAKESKEASGRAETKAQEVYDLVNSLDLNGMKNDVAYLKKIVSIPYIQEIKSRNNATATFSSNFVITVSANGLQEELMYRAICDNFDSGWTNSKTINITGLSNVGVKTIRVFVSNYPDDPDFGGIAMKEFTFFKL